MLIFYQIGQDLQRGDRTLTTSLGPGRSLVLAVLLGLAALVLGGSSCDDGASVPALSIELVLNPVAAGLQQPVLATETPSDLVTITVDGDLSDWGAIFSDVDNNACDATDDTEAGDTTTTEAAEETTTTEAAEETTTTEAAEATGSLLVRRRQGVVDVEHKVHGKLVSLVQFALLLAITLGLGSRGILVGVIAVAVLTVPSTLGYVRHGIRQWRR